MIKNKEEVVKFLKSNPSPLVRVISTIKDGYVTCIGSVPTICGAELHCSRNTHPELKQILISER